MKSSSVVIENNNNKTKIKMLSLISAGIDSPVSSYLMMRECDLSFLHFDRGRRDDVVDILEVLKELTGKSELLLVVADHDEMMERLKELEFPEKQTCVYCKASMLLFAERMCEKLGCMAAVTGDSLGQVASQTLANMRAEESLLEIPVVRPLIGLDKVEIVDLARRIGTYEISTRRKESCPYTPKHPVTRGCSISAGVRDVVEEIGYEVVRV